ncbi:MAG: hypothetical protein H0V23_10185 [Nocardioidaceae bacterium]|nr:hypothetical protein [Nocardioidaceae bacterium]
MKVPSFTDTEDEPTLGHHVASELFGHEGLKMPVTIYRIWLPLCQTGWSFPPVEGAPVLGGVKTTALDVGCGSALGRSGGVGPGKVCEGWPGRA